MAIPYFAPAYGFGGSVTVAETIVTDLRAAGPDVTVATADVLDERRRMPADASAQPDGAEVVRLPNLSHALAARLNGYAPRGLRAWMTENVARFDLVLLHDVYSAASVIGARAAVRASVPFARQPLGTLSPAPERGRPLIKWAFFALGAGGRYAPRLHCCISLNTRRLTSSGLADAASGWSTCRFRSTYLLPRTPANHPNRWSHS